MNPLASFITLLLALRADLHARFNEGLKTLPPLEQIEAGSAAAGVLANLEWVRTRVESLGADLESTLVTASKLIPNFDHKKGSDLQASAEALITACMNQAGTEAILAAITAKTHLPIEDHNTAVTNAKEAGKSEAETAFKAQVKDLETIATRRTEVTAKLGVLAAAAISDADLLSEKYTDVVTEQEGRITRLTEAGITAESRPKNFAALLACGLNDTGRAEFDARLEMITEAGPAPAPGAGIAGSNPNGGPAPASTPAGGLPPGAPGEKKKTFI